MNTATSPTAPATGRLDSSTFPKRRAARIAGVSYLVMFALAIFANFVVREGMVEETDAAATVANITGSIGLFRLGVLAFAAIFVLDIVIAWALDVVFRDVNRRVSLTAAWLRLAYTALLGVAITSLFRVSQLLGGGSAVGADATARTMDELASFESTWLIGLVAFGAHLVLVGWLIIRSGWVTKALGYVLMFAGVAYVLDTFAQGMLSNYEAIAPIFIVAVALPSMVGEGWLGVWLLRTKKLTN